MRDEPSNDAAGEQEAPGLTRNEVRWIIGAVIAILFGVFIAQNADETKIDFLFVHVNIRLIWIFLVCAVLGAVLDRLLQRRGVLPQTRRKRSREQKDQ
jgi:uncharacterized integral membrane protein